MPPTTRRAADKPSNPVARDAGYVVITDAELVNDATNRVRQLETELSQHRAMLEEAEADPHGSVAAESHRQSIETLEARWAIASGRLAALKKNTEKAGSAPATAE